MKNDSLVSIIIPTHNYSKFLPETLSSVRKQSYTHWECIVIDDGSFDATRDIVLAWQDIDSRIRYVHQEHKGVSVARNNGLRMSNGIFIQFLDADDLLEKEKINIQVDYLEHHPDCDLVYSDWSYFSCNGEDGVTCSAAPKSPPYKPKVSGKGDELLTAFLKSNAMVISSPLVRKSLIDRCNGFLEHLQFHEDWDLWLRCILAEGRFDYHNPDGSKTLIRLHNGSLSTKIIPMIHSAYEVRTSIQAQLIDPALNRMNNKLLLENRINFSIAKIISGDYLFGIIELARQLKTYTGLFLALGLIKRKIFKIIKKSRY